MAGGGAVVGSSTFQGSHSSLEKGHSGLWSQGTTADLDVCRAAPCGGWCGLCLGKSSPQMRDGVRLGGWSKVGWME